ncbi:conserved hypothetical protein [Streptomyces murinus]
MRRWVFGTPAAARSYSRAPSSSTSSVSRPAGILIPACCRQVVSGSAHASTVYVQRPGDPAVTVAPQRSVPGASSRIGVQGPGRPRGSRSTTSAATASCPSRNTVAEISNDSPVTALAGRRPCWTTGRTSRTGIRPTAVARPDGVPAGDLARFLAAVFFAAAAAPPGGGASPGGDDDAARAAAGGVCGAADEWCVAGMTAPVRVNVG